MTIRDLIKNDIDQVQEQYLDFLSRIVRALLPDSSATLVPKKGQEQSDA